MKIAIPVYGSRVMPRFGCTREFMIVSVEDGQIVSSRQLTLTPEMFRSFPGVFAAEDVSVILCGGIHPRFQQAILGQQIQLVWGVIGEWQDVVQAYLNGTLHTNPSFCLRHGHGNGRHLRRGQQRRK